MKDLLRLVSILLSLTALIAFGHNGSHQGDDQIGIPGNPKKASRVIEVTMDDTMRFTPSQFEIKQGETIQFLVKNNGKVKHEMVLGSIKELQEHAKLMQEYPDMEHTDPNQISLAPGETGTLVWKFTNIGTFSFACLQPGHYESGMVGSLSIK